MVASELAGVRCVVFDFDGVILESADIKTDAFLEVFRDYPEHREAICQYHLAHLGISRYEKFEWIHRELLGRPLEDAERERLGERFALVVVEKVLACPMVPGALETLQALQGRLPAYVASGTPETELKSILQQRGLAPYFAGAWGSPLHKVDILRMILEREATKPPSLLFVGDGESDYHAAVEAGVAFIARDTPALHGCWVELCVNTIPDLRPLGTTLASANDLLNSKGKV